MHTWPREHVSHCEAPAADHVPALQLVGASLPVEHAAPAGHSRHWLSALKPVSLEYVAAGHGRAAAAPVGQNDASMHTTQAVAPSSP